MKSGLLGPEQVTRPAPALQQWQKLLVSLGLQGSQRTVPRQRRPLVKRGPLGPEHMTWTVPSLQQPLSRLEKLGLLGLQSRVPRQILSSWRVAAELDLLGPEHMTTVPPMQQQQSLLEKLGLQGSRSTVSPEERDEVRENKGRRNVSDEPF